MEKSIENISKDISLEYAVKNKDKYKYALVYTYSDMVLAEINNSDIDLETADLLEARLFSPTGEIHIFRDDDKLVCKEISDEGTNYDSIIREYELSQSSRIKVSGKKITVKHYLGQDSDGQAYIVLSRLAEIK